MGRGKCTHPTSSNHPVATNDQLKPGKNELELLDAICAELRRSSFILLKCYDLVNT